MKILQFFTLASLLALNNLCFGQINSEPKIETLDARIDEGNLKLDWKCRNILYNRFEIYCGIKKIDELYVPYKIINNLSVFNYELTLNDNLKVCVENKVGLRICNGICNTPHYVDAVFAPVIESMTVKENEITVKLKNIKSEGSKVDVFYASKANLNINQTLCQDLSPNVSKSIEGDIFSHGLEEKACDKVIVVCASNEIGNEIKRSHPSIYFKPCTT